MIGGASIAAGRTSGVADRDVTARMRDLAAQVRDAAAAGRDDMAVVLDQERGGRADSARDARMRAWAGDDRAHGCGDRVKAGTDRKDAARALEQVRAELARAQLDDLTGAYRRPLGELALTNEIARARRSDGRLVLAFVDVDSLKSRNDSEGHAAGDALLRSVVAALRSHLRSYDPVVR